MKNPWEILKVSEGASLKEVNEAYKREMFANHPDKFRDPVKKQEALLKTKEINNAYKKIQDIGKNKSNFEDGYSSGFSGSRQGFAGGSPFDFFSDFFEQFSYKEYSVRKELSLKELLQGEQTVIISILGQRVEITVPGYVKDGETVTKAFNIGKDKVRLHIQIEILKERDFFKVKNDLYSIVELKRESLLPLKIKLYHPVNGELTIDLSSLPSFGSKHVVKDWGFLNKERRRGAWIILFNNDPNIESRNILNSFLINKGL